MTKKHEDQETIIEEAYDEMTTFEDSFVKHWPMILNVAVGIVIVFALFLAVRNFTGKKEAAAASEFSAAKTVPEIEKAIAANPTHPAANFARLLAVKILTDDKKYDEALKFCRQVTSSADCPETYWQAKLDEGYLIELLGRKGEAAESFAKVSADIKFPAQVRNEASYSAGRLFLADGRKDRALAILKGMDKAAGPEDMWTYQAKALLTSMN